MPDTAPRLAHAQAKAALVARFMATRPSATSAARLLRGLTAATDEALVQLWQQTGLPAQAALLAVGGYGRGELYPHSDVDVLLLLPDDAHPALPGLEAPGAVVAERVAAFTSACWDAGLEIGSSVRTLSECLADSAADITVQTALLECRHLAGSRRLSDALRRAHASAIDPTEFLRAKTRELRQRHQKFDATPYALEPNCKESPGGLRDLHMLVWVARAAKLGRTWSEMATRGLITPFEAKQLQHQEGVLRLIRARLHAVAGRRQDRLVFDLQTAVAESFGLRASATERASEVLMHRYYWAAKAVTQLNQIVLLNIDEHLAGSRAVPMRAINAHFADRAGMLEVVSDDLYRQQPRTILETFLVYQQTPGLKGLSARTLRALYNARSCMDSAFRRDPHNRALFMQILRQPSGQTTVLRLMNETSVLGRYLWVFRRIVGRMQHDLFHVYTVDQHILMVLRNVRRFFIPEHAHEFPLCSQLAAEFDTPWLLYLAALFHDVAKGRGGDHSVLGAIAVQRFCREHGVGQADTEMLDFLVRHHLLMSHVAQKQDLADPAVIAAFAKQVGTASRLSALYLLTVADIRGTSPKVWNSWKAKLLEDLYALTARALGGQQPAPQTELAQRQAHARELLALQGVTAGAEAPLWATLAVSYFARHDAADIAWHTAELAQHEATPTPLVRARTSPVGDGLQVLIYTPDQRDLFAHICGYFHRSGFSIRDAKIHTSRAGYALDTFEVQHPATLLDNPAEVAARLAALAVQVEQHAAAELLRDDTPPPARIGSPSRRGRSFPVKPRVTLTPDESGQHWVLSLSANDRPGLLHAVARVLAHHTIDLQLAKVLTLGERVEDTFLVSGGALMHPLAQQRLEADLLRALTP